MSNAINKPIAVPNSGGYVPQGVCAMYQMFIAELVNGNVNVDSLGPSEVGIDIHEYRSFGIWLKASGSGPDFDIQILQGPKDESALYSIPDSGGTPIASVTDTNAHIVPLSPVAMPFLRFRIKGNVGNGANTKLDLYLWMQS